MTENADELPEYDGERLYIGRNLSLDFGMVIVDGTVVEMERAAA